MLTLLMWLYKSPTGHRQYEPKHIERLIKLFDKNYKKPFKPICISDQPVCCERISMPVVMENNFRRLWTFSKDLAKLVPGQVFMCDIDIMIMRELTEYLDRSEPLVLMNDPMRKGATYKYSPTCLHVTGTRPDIWENLDIDAMRSWYKSQGEKITGSDMAWLSYYLRDEDVPVFRQHRASLMKQELHKDAYIVHFSGTVKSWDKTAKKVFKWL